MSTRTTAWMAWSLRILCVALLALSLLLLALNLSHPGVHIYDLWAQETVVAATFPALGLLIVSRRPEHHRLAVLCGRFPWGLGHFCIEESLRRGREY